MAKQTPLINNFTAGELSPKVDVRSDIQKYFNGCRTMENFYPLIEGAAKRMPGTKFLASIRSLGSESASASQPITGRLWFIQVAVVGNHLYCIDIPTFTYDSGPDLTYFMPSSDRAIIDPNDEYYYIGISIPNNGIMRINLPERTEETFLSTSSYTSATIRTIVLDRYNRVLYAVTTNNASPQMVFKIDLETFTIIGTGTLTTEVDVVTGIIDDTAMDYIYVLGTSVATQIALPGMTFDSSKTGNFVPFQSVIDIPNGYGYFPVKWLIEDYLLRWKLSDFTSSSVTLDHWTPTECAPILYNGRLYVCVAANGVIPTKMQVVDLATFTITDTIDLLGDQSTQAIVDPDTGDIYIGYNYGEGFTVSVQKFNANSLTSLGTITWGDEAMYPVIAGQNNV